MKMFSCVAVLLLVPLTSLATVAAPSVSNVAMTQNGGGKLVTVKYDLTGSSAVVTFDVQTNGASGWVSVGAECVSAASGAVWRVVAPGQGQKILWPARSVLPDCNVPSGKARAVVTAWPLDDTPDYLVVDLAQDATDRVLYYPSEAHLPGGLLANAAYRTSKVVLRRIHARGILWTMGAAYMKNVVSCGATHQVMLDHDYYIGVFPMTQAQCGQVYTHPTLTAKFLVDGAMRPMENLTSYYYVRDVKIGYGASSDCYYPHAPNSESFIGLMRTRTGNAVDFELPSEAEWEYACRAGTIEDEWNTGAQTQLTVNQVDDDPDMPGRSLRNQATSGNTTILADCGPSNCTSIVGSYAPNGWGLYDMHGNLREWCLDWYAKDFNVALNGAPNCDGANYADGSTVAAANRVLRGGGWKFEASSCTSSSRSYASQDSRTNCDIGFRVVCRMGLR